MKQLKSSSQDLRRLFEGSITIEYVAEPLKAVVDHTPIQDVLDWLASHDFDVMGVESAGVVTGYVERESLLPRMGGTCGEAQRIFHPSELIAVSTPLLKLMPILQQRSRVFVLDGNRVSGIVTRGDLQKAPVRMLLFGLVTLLEMNLLRLVRRYYPQNSWQTVLTPTRLAAAQKLWQESQARNEATDLLDYLQFCDKRELVLARSDLLELLHLKSKRVGEKLLKSAELLRNRLAHAQDLVNGSTWDEVLSLAADLEALLIRCEEVD